MITIDDFKKVEIRAGRILTAEKVEGSDKLLKLKVDFGPDSAPSFGGTKQVISGIAKYINPEELVGTICAFVTNLEPREIMGLKSEAMIMAASTSSGQAVSGKNFFSLLKLESDVPPGSIVK
jgi:methionine--tRNA ligase beta chain